MAPATTRPCDARQMLSSRGPGQAWVICAPPCRAARRSNVALRGAAHRTQRCCCAASVRHWPVTSHTAAHHLTRYWGHSRHTRPAPSAESECTSAVCTPVGRMPAPVTAARVQPSMFCARDHGVASAGHKFASASQKASAETAGARRYRPQGTLNSFNSFLSRTAPRRIAAAYTEGLVTYD
jgi:hypothetical protein